MKKIILMTVLLALLIPTSLWATAGTCTQAVTDTWMDNKYVAARTLTFVCTASADDGGSYPLTAVSAANMSLLTGWLLMNGSTLNGGTGPTAASVIKLTTALKGDILGGAGKTPPAATAALTNKFTPITDTSAGTTGLVPITADLTLAAITGNAVNSAVTTIVFDFVR
jgi:hypothetical protein